MGKSSGGSAPGGSQTIIQDVAEPFKGFATRSLQRAEDLQGLPSVPFTGVATAPPTPDELVAAQALRNRFMEHDPLSVEALALQRTGADPITAASIQQRQSPFEALLAQESYRRLGERTQLDLQKQRAREVGAGGTDRGRGAIEDHLIRQRAEDQERRIGLEAGQRAFTDASALAQADRTARSEAGQNIMGGLGQRQALGRRDVDDMLKVGAQFREQFIQPELNLERQQFQERRGPASVQNPFGFEQFFSGIRSAAPTPTSQTTQRFAQTPSGLSQIAPIVGAGIQAAPQFMAQGGPIAFHGGGDVPAGKNTATLEQLIELARSANLPVEQMAPLYQHNAEGFREKLKVMLGITPGYPSVQVDETITEEISEGEPSYVTPVRIGRGGPQPQPIGDIDPKRTLGGREVDVDGPAYAGTQVGPREQIITETIDRSPGTEPVQSDFPDIDPRYGSSLTELGKLMEAAALARAQEEKGVEKSRPLGYGLLGSGEKPRGTLTEEGTRDRAADLERRAAEFEKRQSSPPAQIADQSEGIKYPALNYSAPAPVQEAPEEYWAQSLEGLSEPVPPTPGAKDFDDGFATSPESERKYTNSEITGMLQFANTGRGRERLPRGLMSLSQFEVAEELKPLKKQWRKNSKEKRDAERRERIANRRNFRRGQSPIRDTGNIDIDFDSIREALGFEKGGIASFGNGGSAYSGETRGVDIPPDRAAFRIQGGIEELKDKYAAISKSPFSRDSLLGRVDHGLKDGSIKELDAIQDEIEAAESLVGEAQAAMRDNVKEVREKVKANKVTSVPNATPGETNTSRLAALLEVANNLNALDPMEQYYPDAPELTSKQRLGKLLSGIGGAIGQISANPETGQTDFSGMGQGLTSSMKRHDDELKANRKAVIDFQLAQKKSQMDTLSSLATLEETILSGDKIAAETKLAQMKADHPFLDVWLGVVEKEMELSEFRSGGPDMNKVSGLVRDLIAQITNQPKGDSSGYKVPDKVRQTLESSRNRQH